MSHRTEKIEHLIKEQISLIILYELQDLELGFVTVTNVKMSPDLRLASIYISVLERDKRELVLEKIKANSKIIRSELASRIRMKFIPEIRFFIDDTMDYVEKIDGLIKKIHEDDDNKEN